MPLLRVGLSWPTRSDRRPTGLCPPGKPFVRRSPFEPSRPSKLSLLRQGRRTNCLDDFGIVRHRRVAGYFFVTPPASRATKSPRGASCQTRSHSFLVLFSAPPRVEYGERFPQDWLVVCPPLPADRHSFGTRRFRCCFEVSAITTCRAADNHGAHLKYLFRTERRRGGICGVGRAATGATSALLNNRRRNSDHHAPLLAVRNIFKKFTNYLASWTERKGRGQRI